MGKLHRICSAGLLLLACSGSPEPPRAPPRSSAPSFPGNGGVAETQPGMQGAAGQAGAGGMAGAAGMTAAAGAAGVPARVIVVTGAAGDGFLAQSDNFECARISADYSAALNAAQVCDPLALGPVCQRLADLSVACPGCRVPVTDTSALDVLRIEWTSTGCNQGPNQCPAVTCANLGMGLCIPRGPGGVCDSPTAIAPIPPSTP